MLEQAQIVTKDGDYERVRYARFADDLVVLTSSHPCAARWGPKVERRLREEFRRLDLTVNEEKTRTVNFAAGEPFDFLGYTFRWVDQWGKPGKKMALCRPQRKKRTRLLQSLKEKLGRSLHLSVEWVVRHVVNPTVRGWVNYFGWGHAGRDLQFVRWQVDLKVRWFASRQRPKRRGGRRWTTWSSDEIYGKWSLFSAYRVARVASPGGEAT